MKHGEQQNPIKLQTTDANLIANEIGKNMGYFHKTPKSNVMSHDQFFKAASVNAPASTPNEKKNKL
jgi:trehalose/maltose hydrolase-like predicted phosphorylase